GPQPRDQREEVHRALVARGPHEQAALLVHVEVALPPVLDAVETDGVTGREGQRGPSGRADPRRRPPARGLRRAPCVIATPGASVNAGSTPARYLGAVGGIGTGFPSAPTGRYSWSRARTISTETIASSLTMRSATSRPS